MPVIDLNTEREARNAPDADCITADQHGAPMYLFAIDYQFDSRTFSFQIWAYSWEDAESRVASMRESMTVAGKVKATGSL